MNMDEQPRHDPPQSGESETVPPIPPAIERSRNWLPLLVIALAMIAFYAFLRPHAAPSPLKAPANRSTATDFVARDLDGRVWSLADQKGKVVLVNYWATWCPPCRQELPELVKVARQYAGPNFAMVGVSVDEGGPDVVRRTVTAAGIPYPILLPGPDSQIASGLESIPVTLLIDRQGRIAKRYNGAVTEEMLKTDIDALIKES